MTAPLLIAASAAAAPPQRGFVDQGLMWDTTDQEMKQELDAAQRAKANTMRVVVSWGALEPTTRNQYDSTYLAKLDSFVNGSYARGIKPILTFWQTPCWASSYGAKNCADPSGYWGGPGPYYKPTSNGYYSNTACFLANRYYNGGPSKLGGVEVWNEPNNSGYWYATPLDYVNISNAVWDLCSSKTKVLAGALSWLDTNYLNQLESYASFRTRHTSISVHNYVADPSFSGLAGFRAAQVSKDSSPISMDSIGWYTGTASGAISESQQASNFAQAWTTLGAPGYVDTFLADGLRDSGANTGDPNNNYGSLHNDFHAKPAFYTLQGLYFQNTKPALRGVQVHPYLTGDPTDPKIAQELDLAQQTNSNTIRADFPWSGIEYTGKGDRAQFGVDKMDAYVNGANSRGMKTLVVLSGTPCWASSMPGKNCGDLPNWWATGGQWYPPTNAQDYGDLACWIINRYGTKLAGFEVWNEPNLNQGTSGFKFWQGNVAQYMDIARSTWNTCKGTVPIVVGALSSTPQAYLSQLYDNGLLTVGDAVSVHPYAEDHFNGTKALRTNIMEQRGDTKPLWATEYGEPTGLDPQWHVTEQQQAQYFTDSMADFGTLPWLTGEWVYELRDQGTDVNSQQDNFGIAHNDFSQKPAFTAVAAAQR